MDLFGEAQLSCAKAPSCYFVEPVQPLQRDLPIRANVKPRHSENKTMQNIFQRLKGGKPFNRRVRVLSP